MLRASADGGVRAGKEGGGEDINKHTYMSNINTGTDKALTVPVHVPFCQ